GVRMPLVTRREQIERVTQVTPRGCDPPLLLLALREVEERARRGIEAKALAQGRARGAPTSFVECPKSLLKQNLGARSTFGPGGVRRAHRQAYHANERNPD